MFFRNSGQSADNINALLASESKLNQIEAQKDSKCSSVLSIKIDSPSVIKLQKQQKTKVPILITLQTKDLSQELEQERVGIDLICVIDVSGSMSGTPLKLVQKSLSTLLELLGPSDRLSLVTFSEKALLQTPLLSLTEENKQQLQKKLQELKAAGGTDIAQGVRLAAKVFQNRKQSNKVSYMFLLSDGNDNEIGTVKRVQNEMVYVKNVGIYTFGYGEDNEAKIMSDISGFGTGGHYYFIQRQQDVEEFFVMALGGCVSVFVWDAKVTMKNAYGNIAQIFVTKQEQKESIWRIGALLYGKEKQLVLEMEFDDKLNDADRERKCLDIEFSGKEVACGIECTLKADLTCKFALDDEEVAVELSEDLAINYFIAKGKQLMEKVQNKMENSKIENDFTKAQQTLLGLQNQLEQFQYKDNEKLKQFSKGLKLQLKASKKKHLDQNTKNALSRRFRQIRSRSASMSSASCSKSSSRSDSRSRQRSRQRYQRYRPSRSRSRSNSRSISNSNSPLRQQQRERKRQPQRERKTKFRNLNNQQKEWTTQLQQTRKYQKEQKEQNFFFD